jgi:hypothetical protein
LRQSLDAGAVVAAIRMTGGEIEARPWPQRLLDAAKLRFKIFSKDPLTPALSPKGRGSIVSPPIGERARVRGKINDLRGFVMPAKAGIQ